MPNTPPLQRLLDDLHLDRDGDTPLYEQLAEYLTTRIEKGALPPGTRLPPHRDIASQLEINITTVTRAIAELKTHALVESRPGRGTRVAAMEAPNIDFQTAPSNCDDVIDLSVNRPALDLYTKTLSGSLATLADDPRYTDIQDYQQPVGPIWARTAYAQWWQTQGLSLDPARLTLIDGAQHGLSMILRSVTQPGEEILADSVTYQGINALCHTLGRTLIGVDGDAQGMSPEQLEAICQRHTPRVLFLVPCMHNPTTRTLSKERRQAIVEIARRHDLLLIEDDVYRPLQHSPPPPLLDMAPERTFHVSGFSKCVAPGLRFGAIASPADYHHDLAAAMRIDCWSSSPLTALIATRLLESGDMARIIDAQHAELVARHTILLERLGKQSLWSQPGATHAWLLLPEPWRGTDFVTASAEQGVRLLPASAFTLRKVAPPAAVRINLAAARSRDALAEALSRLDALMRRGHHYMHDIA
ncbi:PLP-dependent aminotransferase family protein [Halomonas icarae]|uniref:aminotransferase-like domain-containing protein n=1 Tax=Halomonas icarae TaxID=2691040 RepID=UPI0019299AE7|nr:PLP-dependent aminotransferase family protein [Halomonas icarae]MDR5901965.1 PLP-dependent aminotransferase family protein [Halomonas icarae]